MKMRVLSYGMPVYTHNYLSIVIKFVETLGIVSSRLRITCLCNCMSIRKELSLRNIRHDGDSDDDMSATSLRFDDAPSRSLSTRYSQLLDSVIPSVAGVVAFSRCLQLR